MIIFYWHICGLLGNAHALYILLKLPCAIQWLIDFSWPVLRRCVHGQPPNWPSCPLLVGHGFVWMAHCTGLAETLWLGRIHEGQAGSLSSLAFWHCCHCNTGPFTPTLTPFFQRPSPFLDHHADRQLVHG